MPRNNREYRKFRGLVPVNLHDAMLARLEDCRNSLCPVAGERLSLSQTIRHLLEIGLNQFIPIERGDGHERGD